MTTHQRHPALRPAVLCLIGVALIVAYRILAHYRVGTFGAPSDIGGGALPLAGLIFIAAGIVSGLVALAKTLLRR